MWETIFNSSGCHIHYCVGLEENQHRTLVWMLAPFSFMYQWCQYNYYLGIYSSRHIKTKYDNLTTQMPGIISCPLWVQFKLICVDNIHMWNLYQWWHSKTLRVLLRMFIYSLQPSFDACDHLFPKLIGLRHNKFRFGWLCVWYNESTLSSR